MPALRDASASFSISHRFCVAPMLDWTDRHCRYFHRLLSRHARLYTEMVTCGALLHGSLPRHLNFNDQEHPVALQVGGSEPSELAQASRLATQWGYDEINLNCGCPSERVQKGSFGACLMAEPKLVADGVKAMRDASPDLLVTVKHRIGLDDNESFEFLADFVGTVAQAGCQLFIVHARNAWLKGLSPKQNREVPALRYERVLQLKATFPDCHFVVNGGIDDYTQVQGHIDQGLGVMVGRKAYQDPYFLSGIDQRFFDSQNAVPSRESVVKKMAQYLPISIEQGAPPKSATRHMLGLYNGLPRARLWRQRLSDPRWMDADPVQGLLGALAVVMGSTNDDRFDAGIWADAR